MFTDQPVTPTRLETLLDLLRGTRHQFDREKLGLVLQPEALPDLKEETKRNQTGVTLKAATDLGLVEETGGTLRLTFKPGDTRSTREIILQAMDERVLARTDVEPYFAPFYAWLLGLGRAAETDRKVGDWALTFESAVFPGERPENPFNATKLGGLHRWMGYAGLGWYDTGGIFQANPYERLARRFPAIFAGDRRLAGDEFIRRLGAVCPELDGGDIFLGSSPGWQPGARACTPGLSHALVDLHLDGRIVLNCARDSAGWSIAAAEPPHDGRTLQSSRLDSVELP